MSETRERDEQVQPQGEMKFSERGYFLSGRDRPGFTGNVLFKKAIWIIVADFFERSGYYWCTSSMVNYFKKLNLDLVLSNNLQATFQAIVYVVPILSAYLVDAFLGRLIVLPVGAVCTALGVIMLCFGESFDSLPLIYVSLFVFLATFGALVKPCAMVLGGDQFELKDRDQVQQKVQFFSMFYWATNVGAMIAFLVAPTIAESGMGIVSADNGFLVTYIVAAGCYVCLALVAVTFGVVLQAWFVRGARGSALPVFLRVTGRALNSQNVSGILTVTGMFGVIVSVVVSIPNFFITGDVQAYINYCLSGVILVSTILLIVFGRSSDWVSHALGQKGTTAQEVNYVASVWRLAPYIAFSFPFWAIYNQMNTNMINKNCQSNNYLGDSYGVKDATFAAPSMSAFNSLAIVLIIPIVEYVIVPQLRKRGIELTLTRRMLIGLCWTALAMVVATCLEVGRKIGTDDGTGLLVTPCGDDEIAVAWCDPNVFSYEYIEGVNSIGSVDVGEGRKWEHPIPFGSSKANPLTYVMSRCISSYDPSVTERTLIRFVPVSTFSIWWSIIELTFVGLGELFFAIACTDFFYSQVPPELRAVAQAVNMLTVSLGTLLGAVIDVALKPLLPENLNDGNAEAVFMVNGVFMVVTTVALFFVKKSFVYREEHDDDEVSGSGSDESELGDGSSSSTEYFAKSLAVQEASSGADLVVKKSSSS